MARFFIERPIFAWVLAIMVTLAGVLATVSLPLEQYPNIAPPSISINANYPGASAETIQNSVTQVIEQQLTGLDNLLYMSATSSSSGTASITLTFDSGTDADIAQVQVQNKVSQAEALLPQAVRTNGLTVTKSGAGGIFMVLGFTSSDGSMDATDIGDFVAAQVQEPLSRINGMGLAQMFGSEYAMRIWLDPEKLAHYNLMPSDINAAVAAQNADVSAGALGDLPAIQGQQLNASVTSRSKLRTVEQFQNIVLRSDTGGAVVVLSDVARVEVGSELYSMKVDFNGKPSAGIALQLAAGANALAVAKEVDKTLKDLKPTFPVGLEYEVAYETTPFVRLSISEVVKTLFEAIALVVVIMYLFLQNWRATLIPVVAVPVVIMGTFGVLAIAGFSINTLTMFALVLAIGLLVDDAIVVVENVERVMSEEGLSPRDATIKSMDQITGALVGIALVVTAVFLPMAFFGGATGQIYRQFSVTIGAAMLISMLVALTLSPAMCATLLPRIEKGGHTSRSGLLGRFFKWFNQAFEKMTGRYGNGVVKVVHHRKLGLLAYALAVAVMAALFLRLPSSFLPEEDQGVLMVIFNGPAGATMDRTLAAVDATTKVALAEPGVESIISIAGFSTNGNGQNAGMAFVRLKDWKDREETAQEISAKITGQMMQSQRDIMVFAVAPPALPGLGNSSGFSMQLVDSRGIGHEKLVEARDELIAKASQNSKLTGVRANSLPDAPTLKVELDDRRAGALGLDPDAINLTLSTVMGGTYVNDFLSGGRVKRVYVQGDASARMQPEDIGRWFVRNSTGQMVPFTAFSSPKWEFSPALLGRFNGVGAMDITGDAAPGVSSGTAMAEMSRMVSELPQGVGAAWSGMSYQEQAASSQTWVLYAISLVFVFLCLAALYESWSVPVSVLLAVPLGIVGALLATTLRGLTNDVFFQVGMLATMGLAAKNGILIVEFAKDLEARGEELFSATIKAARMRLRPIVMTSLAFMLGVLPMVLSTGAGSAGRHSLGTGVLGGTLMSTALGIFFVPLFYILVRLASNRISGATNRGGAKSSSSG